MVFKGQSQKWQVLKKTWSEMTIPEIGRQDAVLQFVFWGDIAVVFKEALKERSRLRESWLRLWFNDNLNLVSSSLCFENRIYLIQNVKAEK